MLNRPRNRSKGRLAPTVRDKPQMARHCPTADLWCVRGLKVTLCTARQIQCIQPILTRMSAPMLSISPGLLKHSAPARVVNVCSSNHFRGEVNFSHFKGEDLTYKMDNVYNNTKLHQIICTNELARMLHGSGTNLPSLPSVGCVGPLAAPLLCILRKKIPFAEADIHARCY